MVVGLAAAAAVADDEVDDDEVGSWRRQPM